MDCWFPQPNILVKLQLGHIIGALHRDEDKVILTGILL